MSNAVLSEQGELFAKPKGSLPPMLAQYQDYKSEYPDCIIFYQVGDFYEVFFEDAVKTARILNITLTTRDKSNTDAVPMCGVPQASVDTYLERLVDQGHSVALVSQINSATSAVMPTLLRDEQGLTKTTGKVAIQRRLTRIVTPGVRILGQGSASPAASLVVAIGFEGETPAALCWCDPQSGKVHALEDLTEDELARQLETLEPKEIIAPKRLSERSLDFRNTLLRRLRQALPAAIFKFRGSARRRAGSLRDLSLIPGYSGRSSGCKFGLQLLIDYLDETVCGEQLPILEIGQAASHSRLSIDAATRKHLELVRNSRDAGRHGTLYALLDHTVSAPGSRVLHDWILHPLIELAAIQERLAAVSFLKDGSSLRAELRSLLTHIADLERIAVRVELGACQPRELGAVRDACGCIPKVVKALEQHGCEGLKYLAALMKGIVINPQLNARLQAALSDDLPIYLGEQDTIRSGFDAELDRVRGLRSSGRAWIAEFEERQRSLSGIGSLKVKFNNVLGYFIEVTRPNLGKVPTHYIRRQSTVSCERFTTEELNKRELEVLGAEERERALEKGLFEELRLFVAAFTRELREVSAALGQLDALSSLAETAVRENFVEPEIDDSADLIIEQGKHAVLSKLLQDNFVPNSTQLLQDDKRCFVLTGPNMGGKSTYLRQIGLIVILAQIGSFVPARSARIGIVDKIFARIGASDNIAEGESTFLVEMREASNIVNCATERSLLLIDEIGRGTATADGLAIAQAVLEWAAKKGARTIFATHFHELTGLAHHLPQIGNLCVASAEEEGEVVFLHQIHSGAASRSYGIEVARMAGLPRDLLERARQILTESHSKGEHGQVQIGLFAPSTSHRAPQIAADADDQSPAARHAASIVRKISDFDINARTALEALVLINELKQEIEGSGGS